MNIIPFIAKSLYILIEMLSEEDTWSHFSSEAVGEV